MNDKLRKDDRVSFTQRTTYRPYLRVVTGTVVDLTPWGRATLARVRRDDGLLDLLVPINVLERVEAQDDVQDYLAVAEKPFELIADDYYFATGEAGNLGGVEW